MKYNNKISILLLLLISGTFIRISLNLFQPNSRDSEGLFAPRFQVKMSAPNMTGTTELVSNSTITGSTEPAIAIDNSQNVYIAWQNWSESQSTYIIYYRFRNSTTHSWSDIEIITDEGLEPDIAVDGSGNVFIAWTKYGTTDIYITRWSIDFKVWIEEGRISERDEARRSSITVDQSGNFHIVWRAVNGSEPDNVYYRQWNASATSWGAIENVSSQCVDYSYAPIIATDSSNNLHVAWEDTSDYNNAGTDKDIFYRFRNASSEIWGTTEIVSDQSDSDSQFPSLCVDSADNTYITWSRDFTKIFVKSFNASSKSWNKKEGPIHDSQIQGGSRGPSISADDNQNVYMIWNADLETDDGYYVCYARWDPLMRNWTMLKKLSSQSVDFNSYLDLAVNGSGICYATWNSEGSIYLRKTTSDIPDSFELDSDADTPDLDKNFELQWGEANNADYYEIYNDTTTITNPRDANLLERFYTDNAYSIEVEDAGKYYYMIVAKNQFGNTSSNCLEVEVGNAPTQLTLSYTQDSDTSGDINLTWTASEHANNYSLYTHSSYMVEFTSGETIVEEINALSYFISGLDDGTYYYMVVAHNNYANTSSNCISVSIESSGDSPSDGSIPGYNLIILLIFVSATCSIITITIRNKTK